MEGESAKYMVCVGGEVYQNWLSRHSFSFRKFPVFTNYRGLLPSRQPATVLKATASSSMAKRQRQPSIALSL